MALNPLTIRLAMLFATLALALSPQTYYVDASGAGDFTDLPQAVAAASAGDTLVFAPGVYSPTTITKSLNLIGSKLPTGLGVPVEIMSVGGQGLVVDGVPEFVLTNMQLLDVQLRNVPGRLRVDEINAGYWTIENCADVLISRSAIGSSSQSLPGLSLVDSAVQLQECNISNGKIALQAGDAIWTQGQTAIEFIGGRIEGGSTPGLLPSETPGYAINILTGHLDFKARGSSNDSIDGGGDWMGFSGPAIGYNGTSATIEWSGIINTLGLIYQVVPAEPYLEIGPKHTVSPTRRLHAYGPAGVPCFVVMAPSSNLVLPTTWAGNPIRVDLNEILGQKFLTLQGQNTSASYSFTLPSGPAFVGKDFDVQGVVFMPNGELFVTNAAQVILIE